MVPSATSMSPVGLRALRRRETENEVEREEISKEEVQKGEMKQEEPFKEKVREIREKEKGMCCLPTDSLYNHGI